ncbi:MAG: O-antigen ligase family protein [Gammaproteobacteria bacterium]|nr:O-antigen ligase family protein [Gammaproteobacteria bacterium]
MAITRRKKPEVDLSDLNIQKLKNTFFILLAPVFLVGFGILTDWLLPKFLIYGVVLLLGLFIFFKGLSDPEFLIAAFIIYLPMAKAFKFNIAPMVNGTNAFFFAIFVCLVFSSREKSKEIFKRPIHIYVAWYAVLSTFSGITTILFIPDGISYLLGESLYEYKAWVDQFVLYFLIYKGIDNKGFAKRVFFYMILGSVLMELYAIEELLKKIGRSSIEKSRVDGPLYQPNDFGAFIVYTSSMLIALIVVNIRNLKAWVLAPYLLFIVRLLLSTFSRGAYLGFAAVGLVSAYVKGKSFLISMGLVAVLAVMLFPELVPNSLKDRMSQTTENDGIEEKVDQSTESRFVLWDAAVEMTKESPLIGKGFKAFRYLKAEYTKEDVRESDTHSMYLYLSSQMGIPVLVLFLLILWKLFIKGRNLYLTSDDKVEKAIGLSAASMVAGVAVINVFGSRMVNIEVCAYVWIMVVIIDVLTREKVTKGKSKSRDFDKQKAESLVASDLPKLNKPL